MRDEMAGSRGDCARALGTLSGGEDQAARGAWRRALAHAADCPACQDRLGELGMAILAPAADAVPCAECQARLPGWLVARDRGVDPSSALPLTAAHLADCPRCAAVLSLLAPTAPGWVGPPLPEPPTYPRFDTSFLADRRRRAPGLGLAARWAGLLDRVVAPDTERPRESPVSMGVLGVAMAAIILLALVAGTWVLLQPNLRPLPLAPLFRMATATPTATAGPTATATPTVTSRPARGSAAPATPATPAGAVPTSATTPSPPPEPTERRRPPLLAPSPMPTQEPYPGWQEPPTREPYPGPTDETAGEPYPGPSAVPPPTANPYP